MIFPEKRLLARIVLGPVAAMALVGAVVSCSSDDSSSAGAVAVGSCVEVSDNAADAMKATVGDCSSAKSSYRIAQLGTADCTAGNATFNGTVGDAKNTLCLVPNFAEGSCYADAGTRPAESVACTAPEASFKVVKRIDGETDELLCGVDATQFRTVPEPKTTFCMAKPQG
ncbi:LppU/SCO3897 family protein [Nocardia sp. IBHARD005]|uniref:LppU/SCO3897 family protein n=1 Tax=Nocardia sp. IBHARD005 TaxID=3457765 RepID=UPI004058E1CE